ncbi:hypothetical protein BpHYR1_030686, partial [Brachionus plicatilis]
GAVFCAQNGDDGVLWCVWMDDGGDDDLRIISLIIYEHLL